MSAVAFCNSMVDDAKVRSAVRRLTLVNFRNYKYLRLNLKAPFIVLSGENGSGKTNVLEAVSFLSQGRGLRNAKLSEVKTFDFLAQKQPVPVFINNNGWAVSAQIEKMGEEFSIGTAVESVVKETGYNEMKEVERRNVQINEQKLASQNELGQYISIIWLTPSMDRLFQSGPQQRRSFLDRIVYAFDTEHAKRTANFEHLYREWYRLIKEGKRDNHWFNALEEQMAATGVAIAAARREQVARLNAFIENEPDDIFPSVRLELDGVIERALDNKAAVEVEDEYRNMMQRQRRFVLENDNPDGINRTDFKVYFKRKGMPADLCSTGEQKSLLISILLAQTKCQTLHKGFAPVMLLDEVAAHLDDIKREALLEKIKNLNIQAWITTTDPQLFASIRNDAQFLKIKNNQVCPGGLF